MNQVALLRPTALPALVAAAGDRASMRFLEFFAANIRNPHTRRAYYRAAEEFLAWCASAGVPSIGAVQPVHVATWIEAGTRELAAPSVKQRLAAIRHLFDWLVTGQIIPVNPALWGGRPIGVKVHGSVLHAMFVGARNDVRPDAQSRAVSDAHSLRLERLADAHCLRLSARSLRRTRDRAARRTIIETEWAGHDRLA
jgi:hypothetical protein